MSPQQINSKIKSLGIRDVQLAYDEQLKMWAVVQVFKPSGNILLMRDPKYYETAPILLWWCKTLDGHPRPPSEQDLSDIVVTVKRAQIWFDKGSDAMIDEIEAKEKETYDKNRAAQSERIRSFAKPLKKYMRKEGVV